MDVVFECCGQQDALDQALEIIKPGGKLVIEGIPTTDHVSFAIDKLRRREITIINVRRQNECVEPALELIRRRLVNVDFMATHAFPPERTQDAFELVAAYKDDVLKAMIRF